MAVERYDILGQVTCQICEYFDPDSPGSTLITGTFACLRHPMPIFKEPGQWCGDFKRSPASFEEDDTD